MWFTAACFEIFKIAALQFFLCCRYQHQVKLPSQPKGVASSDGLTAVACINEVSLLLTRFIPLHHLCNLYFHFFHLSRHSLSDIILTVAACFYCVCPGGFVAWFPYCSQSACWLRATMCSYQSITDWDCNWRRGSGNLFCSVFTYKSYQYLHLGYDIFHT